VPRSFPSGATNVGHKEVNMKNEILTLRDEKFGPLRGCAIELHGNEPGSGGMRLARGRNFRG